MTQFKAIYKGSSKTADSRYYLQIWEYRGHKYEVEVPSNAWMCSSDYQSGGYNSQYNQHRREQEAIDAMLDNPKEELKKWKYEGSAQEGLDLFFNLVEGE